jgi:glycosyltransferase involved in cell wall biosynthesis
MRVAAYTDYVYRRQGNAIFAERAFALFMARLGSEVERLTILGRLEPQPGTGPYELPAHVDFVPLPHYPDLSHPLRVARATLGSLRAFWSTLSSVDVVWLLGPHPLGLLFAVLAGIRRRRIVLGVRQDTVEYARTRHPNRRSARMALLALDWCWRTLARGRSVVVVGPGLAQRYRAAGRVLPITVSLIRESELAQPDDLDRRDYGGTLTALSVGRLEREKNPLLLADALAAVRQRSPRWRLVVCGDGPMAGDLEQRLAALRLLSEAELRGYVAHGDGLGDEYRAAHAFLHISWTEGLPQVLFEAFAAALPVVATDVGGVAAAVGDAALLIPPGDAEAAADALDRLAEDPQLRRQLVERGLALAGRHTLDAEAERLAAFLADG